MQLAVVPDDGDLLPVVQTKAFDSFAQTWPVVSNKLQW